MFHEPCKDIPYHASLVLLREITGLEWAAMLGHSHSKTNKILSTFSSTSSTCSSDHHNLSKGSCTGLFFQLFDWNGRLHKKQRLRRKSLPAERPASPVLRDRNGECPKVPADQNLKISDPCYPRDMDGHGNGPLQREPTPPEKKKVKRSPNVVAKLMGLETMPSPDFRREKWPDAHACQHRSPLRIQNHEERSFLSHSRIPSSRRSLLEMGNGKIDVSTSMSACRLPCLSQGPPSIRHDEDALQNNATCDASVLKMSAKNSPPSALTMQDCKFGTILSPSNTHNKLSVPVKSPLASKARACLFEAANKILERSKQPKVAAHESADGNNENENKSTIKRELNFKQSRSSSASACPPSKPSTGGNCGSTISLHAARSKEPYSAMAIYNEGVTTKEQFYRGSGIHEEVDSSKCHQNQQGSGYGKEDKRKLCVRRQEKSCRQRNESAGAKVKNVPPNASSKIENRGPSYHKIRGLLPEHQGEVQGTSSSTSSMSSVITQSSTNTNIVKSREILSSHRARTDKKTMGVSNRGTLKTESLTRRGSLSKRGAGTTSSQECILKSRSAAPASTSSGDRSVSQSSHSVEESVCTDQLDSICEYGHPAEFLSFNSRNSNGVVDVSSLYPEDCLLSTSIEITNDDLNKTNYIKDSRVGKSGFGGNCSSSVEETSDTATSRIVNGLHKKKQTVSYSGKSTATILHELLSALNRPARPLVAENNANSELSDITSRTIQTGEWSSMEEHTKEDFSYSCISEEECSGSISKTEDLLLRSSREDQQQTSSLTTTMNSAAQERQIQSSYFEPKSKRKGEPTFSWPIANQKPTYELTKYVVQSEEDYVKCIVDNSNSTPQHEWRPSGNNFLVDPALYGDLETTVRQHWELKGMPEIDSENWSIPKLEWYENLARNHRKLVFDCVGEALNLDVGISQQPPQWSSTPDLECLQSKTRCQRVIKHLSNWRGVRCGMNVDDLVEKAMNTGSGKWEEFSDEISGIPEQVEHMVIDDLIDELLLELRSSQQTSVNVRGVNNLFLTNERKALIWVGL